MGGWQNWCLIPLIFAQDSGILGAGQLLSQQQEALRELSTLSLHNL
jgi:hypothetical protein